MKRTGEEGRLSGLWRSPNEGFHVKWCMCRGGSRIIRRRHGMKGSRGRGAGGGGG